MVIKSWGRRGKGGETYMNLNLQWIPAGWQSAEFYENVSSWKWNQESYRTSTSTSSATHAMATADKFIKCFSRKRDRERQKGREWVRGRANPNQRGIRDWDRTWPYSKICPWNSIPFLRVFSSRDVALYALSLSLSFSLFFCRSFSVVAIIDVA